MSEKVSDPYEAPSVEQIETGGEPIETVAGAGSIQIP